MGSDPSWKQQDPQLPKSIWYHTDALFLGFRLVRPLEELDRAGQEAYWSPDVESILEDALSRVRDEGRGAIGLVDPDLPQAIDSHKDN